MTNITLSQHLLEKKNNLKIEFTLSNIKLSEHNDRKEFHSKRKEGKSEPYVQMYSV